MEIAKIRAQAKVNTQNTKEEDAVDPEALLGELGIRKSCSDIPRLSWRERRLGRACSLTCSEQICTAGIFWSG